jgi:hypothetical protein
MRPRNIVINRLPRGLALDKLECVLRVIAADSARLVTESYTVALVGHVDNLGSESSADELRPSLLGQCLQQLRHSCAVLRVQIGVDLVKNDKRTALSALECENQAESAQT